MSSAGSKNKIVPTARSLKTKGPDQRSVTAAGMKDEAVSPQSDIGDLDKLTQGLLPPVRAVLNVALDQVTLSIHSNKDRSIRKTLPLPSLFASAEGHQSLRIKIRPNSCSVKLDWLDGELVGVRVDGAFPNQQSDESDSQRVFKVRQAKNTVILSLDSSAVPARPDALEKFRDEVTRDIRNAAGNLREDILNAASSVVAAAWRERTAPERVDAALPLVLIAQVQRSGGTLLSQLFDGHPEVWAFPQELKWGGEVKYRWPNIDPQKEGPLQIARSLVAGNLEGSKTYNLFGYQKEGMADRDQRLPYHWSQWAYVEAFLDAWGAAPPQTRRQCLDMFMSAYFSAFLDWQGRGGSKKLITAFTPRVNFTNSYPENEAFFDDYPDGVMISACRHPTDWYASAARHESKYAEPSGALAQWRESAESSLQLKKRRPDHVFLVSFAALVSDPHNVMKRISQRLGLTWHPILTVPTFNGMPVSSNSSFNSVVGIDPTAADRRDLVPSEIRERIEAENLALYERFIAAADIA
jgi:Sulfotransferase family